MEGEKRTEMGKEFHTSGTIEPKAWPSLTMPLPSPGDRSRSDSARPNAVLGVGAGGGVNIEKTGKTMFILYGWIVALLARINFRKEYVVGMLAQSKYYLLNLGEFYYNHWYKMSEFYILVQLTQYRTAIIQSFVALWQPSCVEKCSEEDVHFWLYT
jgi:hypothetical protein